MIAFEILTSVLCHSEAQEVRNERALFVYRRVQDKLTGTSCPMYFAAFPLILSFAGRDFNPDEVLSVSAQVDKLILQATSLENLCQCFSGWYVLRSNICATITDSDTSGVHSGESAVLLDYSLTLAMYCIRGLDGLAI